jgi:hypothetical protein
VLRDVKMWFASFTGGILVETLLPGVREMWGRTPLHLVARLLYVHVLTDVGLV